MSSTTRTDAEATRVEGVYSSYAESARKRRAWDAANPGNATIRAELGDRLLELAAAELEGEGSIVDIGCGTGWLLEALASAGVDPSRLVGVDIQAERAERARARVPEATVHTADARRLPLADESCALVLLVTTLSSLAGSKARVEALREARRVLAPGGLLLCYEARVPNPGNRHARLVRGADFDRAGLTPRRRETLTLWPALARRLGPAAPRLYPLLRRLPALRTHSLIVYRPGPQGERALVFVRNGVTHDARVLRAASTLAYLGYRTSVLGVVSATEDARRSSLEGIPVVRLRPRSLFELVRRSGRSGAGGVSASTSGARQVRRLPGPVAVVHRWSRTLHFYLLGIGALRAHRPRVVHCNDYNTMWIGVAARFLFGARTVYDMHEIWADRNGRPEPRWLLLATEALFVRVAHATITTSPGYARVTARRYRVAAPTLVRNLPARARPPAPRDEQAKPVAVYVGGLLRGRGLEQAIAALPRVPGLRLRLVGPGTPEYREELSVLARECGVAERVEFRGAVAPETVTAAIADADFGLCLIQPVCLSYRLTLPNKLFEYVAAGLPLLASDLPEIAAFVRTHGVGELVAPDDLGAIAAGYRRLLSADGRLRTSVADCAAALSWESEREVLAEVYRQVATGLTGTSVRRIVRPLARVGPLVRGGLRSLGPQALRDPVAHARYLRGRALAARGHYQRAAASLARAWASDRPQAEHGLQLAANLRDTGRREEAVAVYRRVTEGDAVGEPALTIAAINLARLGARPAAERVLRRLRAGVPAGPTWARIAEIEAALGDTGRARQAIEQARSKAPRDRVVQAAAARVLDQAAEPTEALAAARASGDARRERRLVGLLRTLDPEWLPHVSPAPRPANPVANRVLSLLETSLPYVASGYSHRSSTLLEAQRAAGLDPVVVTRLGFPANRGFHHHRAKEVVDGVPHHHFTLAGVTRYTAVPPDELVQTNAELVAGFVRESRPGLLQAATPHLNGLVGLAVARALELPFAYDVRGFPEMTLAVRPGGADSEVYRLRRAAETRCMAAADRVLTLSEAMRDHIVSRGVDPDRVLILPHAVDTDRFAPAAPRRDLVERLGLGGKLVVGFVSSLVEYEGVDVLLRALARLEGVHGLVVGDGPVLPDLRRLTDELGIAERVTFTGRVPFEQVRDHYALIDVFACPRKDYEVCRFVTPLKPFEAMAMGRCLVTSDVPALAELTNGGRTGRTFRAGDPGDLAQVLGELAESPDMRRALGEAAREHVVARHGMAALVEAVREANPVRARPGSY